MDIVFMSASLAIVLVFWGALIAWRWRATYQFSKQLFIARRRTGEIMAHVNEVEFVAAYVRSEGPRAATYTFVCALFAAILVPTGMVAFSVAWQICWQLTGELEVFRRGTMVHVFAMVLVGMAVMILVSMIGMRRYHSKVPVKINKAIKDLNSKEAT